MTKSEEGIRKGDRSIISLYPAVDLPKRVKWYDFILSSKDALVKAMDEVTNA